MRTQVSAVALIAALLNVNPAFAQLSLGGGGGGLDLGVNVGGDNGVNLDVGVDLGGQSGLGVDVDAGVGGDTGLGVGVDASVGGSDGINVDAGVGLGGERGIGIGANANVSAGSGNTGGGSTGPNGGQLIDIGVSPNQNAVPNLHVSALNHAVRVDALVDLIADPQLAGVDIDAVIDDRRVSIIPINTLLDGAELGQVAEVLSANQDGRLQLLDAINGSSVLSSILGNEGILSEDVLAVRINENGNTEVVILGDGAGIAGLGGGASPGSGIGGSVLDGLTDAELAELDIDLLTDEDLARIDLTLLPNEEQRFDAVVRLLSNPGPSGGSMGGPIQLIDLSAILGTEALGQLGSVPGEQEATASLDAEIIAQLGALGIDPQAVVAIGTADDGSGRIFVDTSLTLAGLGGAVPPTGSTPNLPGGGGLLDPLLGLSVEELAALDVDLLTDEELTLIDLSLLPNEDQRLDAIIRLLGTGQPSSGSGANPGEIRLLDLQALLGAESLADISAILTNDDANVTTIVLDADLLDLLEQSGIAPEAVAAVRLGEEGQLQVFLDADLGTEIAAIDTTLTIGGAETPTPGTGGGGGTGTGGEGTGGNGGVDPGNGAGNGGGTGTETGGDTGGGEDATGNGSGGNGTGIGNGGDSASGGQTGSGGTGSSGGNGTAGNPGTGGTTAGGPTSNASSTASVAGAATGAQLGLVADLACSVGVSALAEGSIASREVIVEARRLELVRVVGCAQPLAAPELDQLREALAQNAPLSNTLDNAGVSLGEVIGATVSGDIITVYLDRPIA